MGLRVSLLLCWTLLLARAAGGADAGKSIFDDDNWQDPRAKPVPSVAKPQPEPTTPLPRPVLPSRSASLPSLPPAAIPQHVPPDTAAQAAILKLVKAIFEKEYQAAAPAARLELSRSLLAEVARIRKNHNARYVLLREALNASIAVGDATLCRQALEALEQSFSLDVASVEADALSRVLARATGTDAATAEWAADAVERFLAAGQYDDARRAAGLALGRSVARDDEIIKRLKAVQAAVGEYEKAKPFLARLARNADDPMANLAVARFQLLVKKDWATALPHLAKSSDVRLRELAARDQGAPTDAGEQFKLASGWWDLAAENTLLQTAVRERAVHWYTKAIPQLPELQRLMAEKRIAEIADLNALRVTASVKPGVIVTKAHVKPVSTSGAVRVSGSQTVAAAKLSGANKVYLLEGEYRVPRGSSLEIEAGAIIVCSPQSQLIVQGTLIIAGTPENPVEFRGARSQPAWWKGILLDGVEETKLEYARVYDAEIGVTILESKPTLKGCIFANNDTGLSVGVYNAKSHAVTLDDCAIAFNRKHGITMHRSSATITSCTITRNGGWGIEGAYYVQPKIVSSIVSLNAEGGIRLAVYDCKLSAEKSVLIGNQGQDIENKSTPEWDLRGNYWGPELTAAAKTRGLLQLPNVVGRARVDEYLDQMPKECGANIKEINGQRLW